MSTRTIISRNSGLCSLRVSQRCSNYQYAVWRPASARLIQKRYAHAAELPELPPWPSMTHPTPYDIFNTTKDTVDKKTVRNHFYTLAKVYHPDSFLQVDNLTKELKAERFKKIVAAYDILRDEKKRKEYDMYCKGWDYANKNIRRQNFYGRDFSKAARYNANSNFSHGHSHTGTSWDNFHQDYKNYQKQQDPEYQKQSWERHKKMVALVTMGCFLVGAIQLKFLMHSAAKDIEGLNRLSGEAQRTVYLANNNYGLGVEKDDRIRRFLAHRDGTTHYDNYGQMRLEQESEKLALCAPVHDAKP